VNQALLSPTARKGLAVARRRHRSSPIGGFEDIFGEVWSVAAVSLVTSSTMAVVIIYWFGLGAAGLLSTVAGAFSGYALARVRNRRDRRRMKEFYVVGERDEKAADESVAATA
jgi:hypothetical protein